MASVTDNFTDTNGTALSSHTPDSGGTWSPGGSIMLVNANTLYPSVTQGFTSWYHSAAPASVNQNVQASFVVPHSSAVGPGICARLSSDGLNGYFVDARSGGWYMWERVGGTTTQIGSYVGDVPTSAKTGLLQVTDATKKVFVDGVERISSGNNNVTASGYFGIAAYYADASTSRYLDNYYATDASADMTMQPAFLGQFDAGMTAAGWF